MKGFMLNVHKLLEYIIFSIFSDGKSFFMSKLLIKQHYFQLVQNNADSPLVE